MSSNPPPSWLHDARPHEPARSAAQIDGLLELLGTQCRRVLDLGCGTGRVLVPLARAGHHLTGVDRRCAALAECRARLESAGVNASLIEADFVSRWPPAAERFDVICCLGNTFMTIADVDDAVHVLGHVRTSLVDGGRFLIDDFPYELWPQLTEGYWQSGLSEDGSMQMVWAPADPVFALRQGSRIDPDRWAPEPDEDLLRLWSLGALRLAARAAGLSAPSRLAPAGLLSLERHGR